MRGALLLAPAVALFAVGASADEVVRHRGRCQSLTILDLAASRRCTDELFVQVDANGYRTFIFRADEAVVLFAAIDGSADASGTRNLPLNRVEFGLRGEVETIPVLSGSCRSTDPAATWRAETLCEAKTLKGHFAGRFITIDGATEPVQPHERLEQPR